MAENKRLSEEEKNKAKEPKKSEAKEQSAPDAPLTGYRRAVPILLAALAVYLTLAFIIDDLGVLGSLLGRVMMGLFSKGAYAAPLLLLIHAVFYRSDVARERVLSRVIFSTVALLGISVTVYTTQNWNIDPTFLGGEFYALGKEGVGGGFIGSILAFALIKLFDYIGVIIIAVAMMAIYVTYFFSAGGSTLKSIGYNLLKGTVYTLAAIEAGIKRLFSRSPKKSKGAKDAAKRQEKLYEDDFFAVDNGIASLEINELGIREERTKESIEARPTLQGKVRKKSEVSRGDELRDEIRQDVESDKKDGYFETADYSEPVRRARAFDTDFEIDASPSSESIYDGGSDTRRADRERAERGASDSADAVFTESFNPFEEIKRDTGAAARFTGATVRESIHEITEEDVERARRNAHFEARKAMLKKMQNAECKMQNEEAAQVNNGEPESKASEVTAEEPAVQIEEREEKAIEYRTPRQSSAPIIDESESTPFVLEKSGQPRYNEIRYTETSAEIVHGRHIEMQSAQCEMQNEEEKTQNAECKMQNDEYEAESREEPSYKAPVYENNVYKPLDTPSVSDSEQTITDENFEETDTPYYFTTERTEESKDEDGTTGLVFEFEADTREDAEDERPMLEIERTRLTYGFESSDDSDDGDDSDILAPDDDSVSDEEIPREEQNPAINGYRDMFSMFREEKEETDAESDSLPEETTPIADEAKDSSEDDYTETEAPSGEEDELDLPFERPTRVITPERPPVQEKKEDPKPKKPNYSNYKYPPLELLALGKPQNDEEINVEIKQNTTTLIETLASFNVTASIKGVDRGPRITRYEVVPARGVKVQAITGLFDDIALNLAAEGIRMEAPIPGKSAIGFEIPNKNPTNVTLRELLECEEFINAKSKTFVCIGKDVAGNPVFGDIAKFPHALVAGATGMGKSVCINSVMISMLYKARPDEVKFIMIDPKKVEFRMYSGIPHLLIPVITEAKQAAGALMWAVEEMERRYSIIEQLNIRNIESYNERCAIDKSIGDPMPKIVIVIDELNDLMMQVRDPVEDLIMRIAQKARAAGIHLIIGTQRPDVKVVTGTIKANINTRISCKVTSVQDSRTILEMAGAEKLLNRGDMLFKPVDKPKPIRVQGCFVSDPEVEAIMSFLKEGCDGNIYDDEVFAEINRAAQKCGNKKNQGGDDDMGDDGGDFGYYSDQQFLDAVELAIRSGKVSTSLLQRKLSIGYGKAAKFIDAMEDIGIVSEQNGQKPRDVLLSLDEWHEKLSRVNFDD